MKLTTRFRSLALLVMCSAVLSAATSRAQSIRNEQYIQLLNYLNPSFGITFGSPTTLATNYTFLLPATAPTGLSQTLQVTGIVGSTFTLGWGSTVASSCWMLNGNVGTNAAINFIGTMDAVDFVTKTNSIERMRITSAGKIGIGTPSPGQLLEIKSGNVLLSNAGTAGQLQMQGTGSGITTFAAGVQGSTNINYTLPTAQGASNSILQNDGSGALSWGDLSSQIGSIKFARKPDGETVTNSSTLQDDDDLYFTIGANETWELFAQLDADNNNGCGAKMKVAVTIPSGTLHVYAYVVNNDADGDDGDWLTSSGAASPNFELNGDDEQGPVQIHGLIVGGATGGTVKIRWAPHTSSSSSVTVHANSYLKATRVQ